MPDRATFHYLDVKLLAFQGRREHPNRLGLRPGGMSSLSSSLIHPGTPTSIDVHHGSLDRHANLSGLSRTVILNPESFSSSETWA